MTTESMDKKYIIQNSLRCKVLDNNNKQTKKKTEKRYTNNNNENKTQ